MTDGKRFTREEFEELFGSEMPIEAFNLVFNSPPDMTIAEIRAKLREIATSPAMEKVGGVEPVVFTQGISP